MNALTRHQQIVERVKAQQAATRAKIEQRLAARTDARAALEALAAPARVPAPAASVAPARRAETPASTPPAVPVKVQQAAPEIPGTSTPVTAAYRPDARRTPVATPRSDFVVTTDSPAPSRPPEEIDMAMGIPDWLLAALAQQYVPGIIGAPGTGQPPYSPTTGGNGAVAPVSAYAPRSGRRRRRRRLLTTGDKADIAFLHGQLGGGQLGRAAISALLSRRC